MQPHYQQPGPGATVAMQYPVTAVQGQGRPYSGGCVGKTLKVTGILHIVGAGLCIVLGIVAICLQAYMSYVAVPLWGSILIFIPTGIVGTVYYCKPKNKCIVVTYLVLTIVSASFAGIMWVIYIIFAANDNFLFGGCLPFYYQSYCYESLEARIAMDALLAVVYFLELACGVTAASASCFKLCQCCRKCCQCCCSDNSPQSGVSYHAVSGGAAPGMTLQAYPVARPIYVAGGGSSVPAAQSAGMMYLSPGSQPSQGFVAVQPTSPPPSAVPQTQQGFVAVQPAGPSPHAMQQSGPSPNVQAGPVPLTGTYTNMQAQGFYAQQPQAFQQSQVQVQQPVQPQVQLQPQVQQQVPQLPQEEKPQQEEKEEGDHCLDTSTEEAAGQVTSGPYTDQTALI